jgi:DNA polymerase-3 subunit gamma/tau
VEIALVKLCKPEMETDQEAILDRLRQLEDQVANGITVQPEQMVSYAVAQDAAPKPKPQLPKAIPEDVRRIVANWSGIVGNASNPMKIYLKTAKLSLAGDGKLLIVLEDGVPSDYFMQHAENRERLEEVLAEFSGKAVEVQYQTVSGRREFEESYVDLARFINMEIEEEDE